MPPDLQRVLDSALRNDFNAFTDKTLASLMGSVGYLPNWHIRAITAILQRMIDGENRFSIILMPPRMGKSLMCSVALPAFLLVRDPSCKIMALSYSIHLATKLHNLTRNILRSPWCSRLNSVLQFRSSKEEQILRDTDSVLETTQGGYRYAASFGGTIRGEGADWTLIDDPMGTTAASSEAERRRAIETFREAIASRLNSKHGRILLVMQRVHFGDLAGHLIAQGGYEVLTIPAVAEEDSVYDLGGGEHYLRPRDSLIDDRRFDLAEVERLRRDLGSEAFEAQYQQSPLLPDGQIFKRKWLKIVETVPDFEHVVVSADIAGSEERGDYSVFLVWGIRDGVWHLTDIYRRRCDFADLVSLMKRVDHEHEPDLIVVERNGLGEPFISRLRELELHNVDGVHVRASKQERAHAVTPLLERGQVAILGTVPGLEVFLEELLTFPSSHFFDQVDAFTLPLYRHADVERVLRGCSRPRRNSAAKPPPRAGFYSFSPFGGGQGVVDRYAERNRDGFW
jgi:predicted phage terminase large subunit-like protein